MSEGTGVASADRTAINSRRAERRREVTRTVKTVREQLAASNGIPPAFYTELYINHARAQMSSALIKPLVITMLGVAANLWTSRLLITFWAIIAITAHITSLFFYRRFLTFVDTKISLNGWRWRFTFLDGVTGFALGMLFVLPSIPNVGTDVFQFSAMLILIAFLSLLSSNVPGSMIASSLPITASISFEFVRRAMAAPPIRRPPLRPGRHGTDGRDLLHPDRLPALSRQYRAALGQGREGLAHRRSRAGQRDFR